MTGRERLDRGKRRLNWAALAAVGLMVPGLVGGLVLGVDPFGYLAGAGLLTLFAAWVAAEAFAFRCDRCRGSLGPWVIHSGWWGLGRDFRSCPHCAADLDAEVPGADDRDGGIA